MKYFYATAIIPIIILSAVFRLGYPDSAIFGGDEDTDTCRILNFIDKHNFPPLLTKVHGVFTISTVRILLYFVMLFIRDPRLITLLIIGIPNTAAVILCFLFCYKFIDKRTAIVSAALFGFSNWAIIYSKKIWGVNILQFFSILVFFILTLGIYKSRLGLIALSILMLPFLPSLHLTSFSIFVSVFLILVIYYSKMNLKYLFAAAVMLTIAILFLSISNRVLHKNFGLDSDIMSVFFTLNTMSVAIDLIVRGKWYYLYLYIFPKYSYIENFCEAFLRVMFVFGGVYIVKKMAQDLKLKRFSAYLIIGIWYFVFIALFGFTNLTTHAHYFMVVLPALFIIASIGFFSLIDFVTGKNKIQNWEFLLLFLIFILWSPPITILGYFIFLFLKKLPQKIVVYSFYSLISFILIFQAISNIQLFNDIKKLGKVQGRAGMDLGAKINAVKYVVSDAQSKFKQTGTKSYYSLLNDNSYTYLFKYLTPKGEDFISDSKISSGYHYAIVGDINEFNNQDMLINSLYYKKIGPKLVIVEKINEI